MAYIDIFWSITEVIAFFISAGMLSVVITNKPKNKEKKQSERKEL